MKMGEVDASSHQVEHWVSVSPGRWGWTQVRIPQQALAFGVA